MYFISSEALRPHFFELYRMKKYLIPENVHYALANLPHLTFEVTDACNLKCDYCIYGKFYADSADRKNKTLSVEKAIRLIDRLAVFWNSDLNASTGKNTGISFYGGEPLLNFRFIETVVDHVKRLNCPHRNFSFSMTTNAVLLRKHAEYLVDNDFGLLISLDGDEKNTAYRVDKRGKPAFAEIEANVDALREKYPEYFERKVNFNAVLHNKNSVEEIYRYFKNKYGKIPSVGELNNAGVRPDRFDEFAQTYRNPQESLYQAEHYEEIERDMFLKAASYKSVKLFLKKHGGYSFRDYTDLLFEKKDRITLPTGTCLPFTRKMFVTVNGEILPCERIERRFALGQVTDSEVIIDAVAVADKYNAYYAKTEKQCSKCKNLKTCEQCLFYLNVSEDKPVCYGFMNETDFENYANAQLEFLSRHPEAYAELMK